jgi:hypothetical protein
MSMKVWGFIFYLFRRRRREESLNLSFDFGQSVAV